MADVVMPSLKNNDGYIRFPHWLPREYKKEINDWLHVIRRDPQWSTRCHELLHHTLMRSFWEAWVSGTNESANESIQIGGNLDAELPKHFKHVIMIMVYRGGPLPTISIGEKLERRKKMAEFLREFRALAREDDRLLDLPASTIIEIARPQTESVSARQRRTLIESAREISFGMMLNALHDHLKNSDQLDPFDAVEDDWYNPKGLKKNRQRLYLELQLEDLFMPIGSDTAQRNLIAMALTIATGEQITATEVGNRQRQRARKRSHP